MRKTCRPPHRAQSRPTRPASVKGGRVRAATLTSKPMGARRQLQTVCKVRCCAPTLAAYNSLLHAAQPQATHTSAAASRASAPATAAHQHCATSDNINGKCKQPQPQLLTHSSFPAHAHGLLCTTHMAMTAGKNSARACSHLRTGAQLSCAQHSTAPPSNSSSSQASASLYACSAASTITPCLLCGPSPSTSTSHSLHPMHGS